MRKGTLTCDTGRKVWRWPVQRPIFKWQKRSMHRGKLVPLNLADCLACSKNFVNATNVISVLLINKLHLVVWCCSCHMSDFLLLVEDRRDLSVFNCSSKRTQCSTGFLSHILMLTCLSFFPALPWATSGKLTGEHLSLSDPLFLKAVDKCNVDLMKFL